LTNLKQHDKVTLGGIMGKLLDSIQLITKQVNTLDMHYGETWDYMLDDILSYASMGLSSITFVDTESITSAASKYLQGQGFVIARFHETDSKRYILIVSWDITA
jgi:hypothetical protein